MTFLHKLALVLEAAADELDAKPTITPVANNEKVAEVVEVDFKSIFKTVTGKEPSNDMLEKISSDPELKETFQKMADNLNAAESLGEPSEKHDGSEPQTKAEKLKVAEERFKSWILG